MVLYLNEFDFLFWANNALHIRPGVPIIFIKSDDKSLLSYTMYTNMAWDFDGFKNKLIEKATIKDVSDWVTVNTASLSSEHVLSMVWGP